MDKKYWFKFEKDKIKLQLKDLGKILSRKRTSYRNISLLVLFFVLIGIGIGFYYNNNSEQQPKADAGITVEPLAEEEITEETVNFYDNTKPAAREPSLESDTSARMGPQSDGKEQEEEEIAGVVTEPVKPLVEEVSQEFSLLKPVSGNIVQEPGWYYNQVFDDWRYQSGVEFNGKPGDIVMAAATGQVVSVNDDEYKGIVVKIEHQNEWKTQYGHLQKAIVSTGERVVKGQEIGRVGSSGMVVEASLYFMLESPDGTINPSDYFE